MIKTGDKFCLKEFLSDDIGEYGSVSWSLEVPTAGKYFSASVIVRDCSRSIELDFDFRDSKALGRRIDKVSKLIRSLQAFEDHLKKCEKITEVVSRRG